MKELSDSKRWHPYLRELWSGTCSRARAALIVAVAEPDTIKVGSASSSKRPALTWRRDLRAKSTSGVEGHPRVWLLGDSMHAMLPSRGQGGNAALADAASALDEIVKLGKDGEPSDARVEAACTAFENEMIPRSFAWVKASENADIYLDKWGGYLAAKTFVGVLRVLCVRPTPRLDLTLCSGYATDVLEKLCVCSSADAELTTQWLRPLPSRPIRQVIAAIAPRHLALPLQVGRLGYSVATIAPRPSLVHVALASVTVLCRTREPA